ncbi:MAG: N-acetyltransferase family protein [Anaerolineales bacterium]
MSTTIREARSEDAGQLVDFVTRLSEETELYIVMQPGEFTLSVDEQAKLIEVYEASDNSAYFIALADGQIVGRLNIKGGSRAGTRHSAVLVISVAKGWRDQGIGSQLMEYAIQWARESGVLKRLELLVFAENARAIHLYEKYGFVVEGRLRQAIYRHDRYYDDLLMALLL